MTDRLGDARVLMYSHDTFGLGHLRRCRAIAHSLVGAYHGLNVLIISGATIAGAFEYRSRVDFVKIPSVIKLRNGEYTSLDSHIDLNRTLDMRRATIRQTAQAFAPDIFIVDKEPMGLRGEVESTLAYLKTRGTMLVLGLRDVMDAPHLLQAEWESRDILNKIDRFYDKIWVYGSKDFYDPLTGLDVPASVRARMDFVGFLQRRASADVEPDRRPKGDYVLVTTGGGGDGAEMVEAILNAYLSAPDLPAALVALGPYMPTKARRKMMRKAAKIPQLQLIDFEARFEDLMNGASAIVAMGGYNTFCEILSFDKPALLIPRTEPREEQLIRARRASELGLVDMLTPTQAADPACLTAALRALPNRPVPSQNADPLKLEGLPRIAEVVGGWLKPTESVPLEVVTKG